MLSRFEKGDNIICFKTNDSIGLTRGIPYEVLSIKYDMNMAFVQIKTNTGRLQFLSEDRFYFDTPENRKKLQIEKMFESYG